MNHEYWGQNFIWGLLQRYEVVIYLMTSPYLVNCNRVDITVSFVESTRVEYIRLKQKSLTDIRYMWLLK